MSQLFLRGRGLRIGKYGHQVRWNTIDATSLLQILHILKARVPLGSTSYESFYMVWLFCNIITLETSPGREEEYIMVWIFCNVITSKTGVLGIVNWDFPGEPGIGRDQVRWTEGGGREEEWRRPNSVIREQGGREVNQKKGPRGSYILAIWLGWL